MNPFNWPYPRFMLEPTETLNEKTIFMISVTHFAFKKTSFQSSVSYNLWIEPLPCIVITLPMMLM